MSFPFLQDGGVRRLAWRLLLALAVGGLPVRAQFTVSSAGSAAYGNSANWTGGIINGVFSQDNSAGAQAITFMSTDTFLSTGLTFNLPTSNALSLVALGGPYVLALGGDVAMASASGTVVTIGGSSGSALNVNFNVGRSFTVAASNTLALANAASGSGDLTKAGAGTLLMSAANTYTGKTTINGGVFTVKTLADGGVASGIGQASSDVANLVLNGGTLQFVGACSQTTDRLFTLGAGGGTLDASGTGTISFTNTNAIAASAPAGVHLTLTGSNTSDNGFKPVLTDNGILKTSLLKTGAGTWVLGSSNTFSGDTTVFQGTLAIGDSAALQNSSVNIIGGALAFRVTSALFGDLSGDQGIALIDNQSNAVALTVGGSNLSRTYTGVLSGPGALIKNGTGAFYLLGANTYTGGTTVNGGTLNISSVASGGTAGSIVGDVFLNSNASSLVFGRADATTFGGAISGSGQVTVAGSGTLTLSGANTYTGGTAVNAGTLVIDADARLGTAPVTATPGQINLNGGVLRTTASFELVANRGVHLGAGGGTIDVASDLNQTPTTLTYGGILDGGALTKIGPGTLVLSGANLFGSGVTISAGTLTLANAGGATLPTGDDVTLLGSGRLQVNNNQTIRGLISSSTTSSVVVANGVALAINLPGAGADPTHTSATFAGVLSGDGGLAMSGPGTFTLTGSNTYSGGTSLNGGTLVVSGDASLGAATGGLAFNGGTLRVAGLSGVFASTRSILLNSGGGTIDTNSYELTFSGTITGTGRLTHQGSGILSLSGTNTYGGGTLVKGGGVLDVTNNANLGTGGVELDGGFLRTRAAIADFTHDILLDALGGTITTYGFNSTISGRISGAGGLTVQTQTGNGVLTLSNSANQYAGTTSILSGTLKIGATNALGALGTGSVSLASGATLDVSFDQTLAGLTGAGTVSLAAGRTLTTNLTAGMLFDGLFAGTGGLTKSGTGTLTLTGDSTNFSGPVSVTGGTLRLGSGGTTGALGSAISVGAGATFEVNRSDGNAVAFGNTVSGAGTFVKMGSATLALTNANAFTGFTGTATISGGTLRAAADLTATGTTVSVASGGTFAVGSEVTSGVTVGGLTGLGGTTVAAGKKLTVAGATSSNYGGAISGDGAFEKSGAGTLTLSGFSSYQGDTWLTAGGLGDGVSGAFSSNSTMHVASGATLQVTFIQSLAGLQDYSTGVSGTLQLGGGAALTINNTASNTFSGTLAGAGTLTKSASGELIFKGTSTYNGSASINAGTLTVGATNAFSANSVTVNAPALFNVAASTAIGSLLGAGTTSVAAGQTLTLKSPQVLGAVIGGDGGVTFANNSNVNGVTTLTASQNYLGTTTLTFGLLQLGNASAPVTLAGSLATGSGTKVVFSHGSTNSTFSQSISGGASVFKHNAGTLTLTGASTYTGTTTVDGGTLKVATTNALPTTTGLTLTANTALDIAANQTINRFVTTDALSSILIESGQVFDVTLGGLTTGTVFDGVISGGGALEVGPSTDPQGGHTVTLTGNNTYTGGTTIDAGGALRIGNGSTQNAGIAGNVLNNGFLIFQISNNLTFNGVIAGAGGLSLGTASNNAGGGELRLGSANTYTGNTDIYRGTLFALNTSGSATGTGHVTLHGGVLAGTGTVAGGVDVLAGGRIAPASALGQPGTLTVGNTWFAEGGRFVFQLNDAKGVVGTDLSLLSVVGALNITATSANPFVVELYSVDSNQAQGLVANFDPAQAYRWQFLTTSGGITGFSDSAFGVDPSQFKNALPSTGGFFVSQTGNNLFLEYSPTAVPEPSTWALLALGTGSLLIAGRRRRTPPQG